MSQWKCEIHNTSS